jgi:hypothetical protein
VTQPTDIAKDAQAKLSFTLNPGSAAPGTPVDTYLVIKSVPNASISVDRTPVGTVPADGTLSAKVAPGKHTVEATLNGYSPASKNVNAKEGARFNVDVSPKANGPTVSFSADTTDIQAGKSATLKWDAQNATEVSIEGLGTFPAKSEKQVSPAANTTYTLIASGPGGKSAPQRVTIKVAAAAAPAVAAIAKPSIGRFELGTDSIQAGAKAKLFWDVQNADSVTIDPEVGTVKPGSGNTSVSPAKTTTYTLTAKGPGGSTTAQQTLTVEAKAEAAAPAQQAPTPAAATGPTDAQMIKQVLEQRYKSALESGDVGAMKAIWPTIPKANQDAVKGARGLSLDLSCNPNVSGDKATASCSQTVTMNGKPTRGSVVFNLTKTGGNWLIQSSR